MNWETGYELVRIVEVGDVDCAFQLLRIDRARGRNPESKEHKGATAAAPLRRELLAGPELRLTF